MKDRFWLKVFGALGLASLVTMLLVVLLYRGVVTPEPVSEELASRPTPTQTKRSEIQTGDYRVAGVVVDAEGNPVAGVRIEAWVPGDNPSWESDAEGTFQGTLDQAATLVLPDRASEPREVKVEGERLKLRFVVAELCPFTVHVEGADGAPLPDAEVSLRVDTGAGRSSHTLHTGPDGAAHFPLAGCGVARAEAHHADHASKERRDLDTVVEQQVTLRLVNGIWLSGVVVDTEDAPIPEARVSAGDGDTTTEDDGSYRLRVDPAQLTRVQASAEGYRPSAEPLRVPLDATGAELDVVLELAREVTVYCAGLPGDSCKGVLPIFCTHPWLPVGPVCDNEDPVVCECPSGQGAIRGGGQNVGVGPQDEVAWLDFRLDGGIEGRVTQGGEPAPCTAMASFVPQDMADLTRGLAITRMAECDETGHFQILGLHEGAWMVDLRAGQDFSGSSRQLPFIQVVDQVVDVGEIDFESGGRITGVVLDGLTGQGKPGVAVVAVEKEPANSQLPRTATGISTSEGAFVLMGLEDGDYEVFIGTSPFDKRPVSVVDGINPGELTLESRGADLLDEQGFHLITDAEGELVVDEIMDGGLAQEAGLESGDQVQGVILFGLDVEEQFPDYDLSETILGSYDGPGVSLKVDRDGEEVVIDL